MSVSAHRILSRVTELLRAEISAVEKEATEKALLSVSSVLTWTASPNIDRKLLRRCTLAEFEKAAKDCGVDSTIQQHIRFYTALEEKDNQTKGSP